MRSDGREETLSQERGRKLSRRLVRIPPGCGLAGYSLSIECGGPRRTADALIAVQAGSHCVGSDEWERVHCERF